MTVLLASVGLFAISFLLQALLWRVRLPRRQMSALLVLYALVPLAAIAVTRLSGHGLALSAPEALRVALFYVSCSLAYVVLYSALEVESPTLAIVSYVAKSGRAGRDETELFARFGQGAELANRLALIEQGALVCSEGDTIRLTPQGRLVAQLFERAAVIFGIARGVAIGG